MNNIGTVAHIARTLKQHGALPQKQRVNIRSWNDYWLLNYAAEAFYDGGWTKTEKACRGLVVRHDGKIMALPMPKFFNLGEPENPPLPQCGFQVWEKLDGSLGIWWHDGEKWIVNTRGSFENEYTEYARWWWNKHIDESKCPIDTTIMTEIVIENDPNPKVAHHIAGLYFVAARNRYGGNDYNPLDAKFIGLRRDGIPSLPSAILYAVRYDSESLTRWEKDAEDTEGIEGWVVRYNNGFRVKIKTNWYLNLFKAVNDLTRKRIKDLMLADPDWDPRGFPEELRAEAKEIYDEIIEQHRQELLTIYKAYSTLARIDSRKEFAIRAAKEYPEIKHWLFRLRDGHLDAERVLRKMEV